MSISFQTQKDVMKQSLIEYFSDKSKLDIMLGVIKGQNRISLRLLEWFITNYSKQYNTSYMYHDEVSGKLNRIKVHRSYKGTLRGYNKKKFDTFCRGEHTEIPYEENTNIDSTIAQFRLFQWVIEKKMLDYIDEHYEEIVKDMNLRNNSSKYKPKNVDNKTRKKREELSVSAIKSLRKENVDISISFN